MTESDFTVVRSLGFLLAVAIAVSLQRIAPHARLQGSWWTNLGLWAINAVVLGVVCGACAYTVARWASAAGVGVLALVPMPRAVAIIASVVVLDVVSYGWHRANHQLRWLWQFHQVHHSDATFTVSTGVRFHPGELLLSLPVRLSAVVVLGAPPESVLFFELIFTVANLVEHGDINLPARLERRLAQVLITPALHRRHHSKQVTELNTNFGTIFSLWDRWFRTFLASGSAADVQTGLPGMSGAPGLLQAVLFPVRYRSTRALR
jgi:sterol desaturase/sphingolipid hydroxylase (fatty acid hydroxylase superfamily)